ncbi:hypothetical protein [Jiangella mangrovi]|uniref:Uncharacterized protein n=1 Tax=Jiangella mangrovi TaxID=1524084 RepID=A0A7W9LLQ6_9ACTN|nr:hypothetical protein [Jiangella mangrovi]MBB5788458.1 hypothetical protein [Jiangella mangrovi]
MSTSIESTPEPEARSRRSLLRGGAAVAAGVAGAAVVAAAPAEAATGNPVILGRDNTSGAGSTRIRSASNPPTVVISNDGYGAGALVTGRLGNGIAAGTHRADSSGLSAANYSEYEGPGSAVAASGGVNTGVSARTSGSGKFAVSAFHSGSGQSDEGGAISAHTIGRPGIVVSTEHASAPAVVAVNLGDGDALLAQGVVRVDGSLYVSGDLVVEGTLYCDDVQPIPAAMRRQVRADAEAAAESARAQAESLRQGGAATD